MSRNQPGRPFKALILGVGMLGILAGGCTTLPTPKQTRYTFPSHSVYIGAIERPYKVVGWVRTKVNYPSLDPNLEEEDLCRNYFNKAARDLLERARKNGGDAVVDMKSVVFLEDGRQETYSTPECSDDGEEAQVLAQGIAIQWKAEEDRKSPPPSAQPRARGATQAPPKK